MKHKALIGAVSLVLISCDLGVETPPFIRWQSQNIANYTLEQQYICNCTDAPVVRLTVRDNRIISIVDISNDSVYAENPYNRYRTIDSLFALLEAYDDRPGAIWDLTYDSTYSYPSLFFLNPHELYADDEFGIISKNLIVTN